MCLIKFAPILSWIHRAAVYGGASVRRHIVLWVFVSFLTGIIINEWLRPDLWWEIAAASAALGGLVVAAGRGQRSFLAVLLAAFCLVGMVYCRARAFLPQDHLVRVVARDDPAGSLWVGRVAGDVKPSQAFGGVQQFELLLDHRMDRDGRRQDVSGRILVKLFGHKPVQEGDSLALGGTLHRPFEFLSRGRFSYRQYLMRRGIFRVLSVGKSGSVTVLGSQQTLWTRGRARMKFILDQALGQTESAIMKAVILGDRTGIRREVREVFARTGTAHILAISGLHMSIVLMIVLLIVGFLPCSLRVKYFLAMIALVLYLPVTGLRVSVIRSAVMSIVLLYAVITERRVCSLNSVGLAGLLILLIRPQDCFMIDFQLSFSAVFAIVIFFPPVVSLVTQYCPRVPLVLSQWFAVSWCAWIGTAGWVLYYFGRLTPGAVLANMCLVWIVPGVIALGFLVVLSALIGMASVSGILAGALTVLLRAMIWMNVILGRIPLMCLDNLAVERGWCLGYYALLIVAAFWIAAAGQKENPLLTGGFPKTM